MKFTPETPDQTLLQEILKGDLDAFEHLVRRHQGVVYRFLYHFLGNAADAEDLTQETFLTLHRKLSQHNPALSFRAWLMTIARHLAISHSRKNVPTPLDPAMLAAAIRDVCPAPERELLLKEASEQVRAALARVAEVHREILVMRYLLDLPLHEVAELLNIPEGTAKSRLFKARAELRERLEAGERGAGAVAPAMAGGS
ncbi:MAG: RNA polymerase ECF-type sigma factor [Candidatus Ozemobacter sibiricus]|jgi:RNA polymerase sigma-70 factor (ECF subfamily)|uniref:RNA polymerase ECF-type sigma factor n=1 Tax=Candidatus Ozemobacter sibiricus TaxID=2268124 RepID=A0A367Z903_9BACT|nr:MAG: RNA polymerase ECF-type sigma factor [Candidatus Ozemobacter sibiricus]